MRAVSIATFGGNSKKNGRDLQQQRFGFARETANKLFRNPNN